MVKNYNEVLYDNETLTTPRLTLRKFKKSDAADILEYCGDAETMEFLIWDGVKTKDEAIAAITNFYWSKPGFYAIELTAEKKCIGCFALRLKPDHEKASFGYMLNKKYWGNGYMTETLTAILSLCFEKLELNRVESTHYTGNEASGRVMQKCGMKQEGIGIQQEKIKGVFRDTVHYGITRDTY